MSLTKQQLIVLDELFENGGDEIVVLKRYDISRKLWHKWLAGKDFADEMAERIGASRRQSRIILSKYSPFAASKLIELCGSENQETARKAAMDIITLQKDGLNTDDVNDSAEPSAAIDPATASKLLAALACVDKDKPNQQ
jgi:hypothetical protein